MSNPTKAAEKDPGYTTKKWAKAHESHTCSSKGCTYSTTDQELIEAHVATHR